MSFAFNMPSPQSCKRCSCPLAPNALECPQCRALVHGDTLQRLASDANALEARGELLAARDHWASALSLLPEESAQGKWVEERILTLEGSAAAVDGHQRKRKWGKLAPLAGVGAVLIKLLKGSKFLLSLIAFMGVYWSIYGAKFGIGFVVLILIHEMGHFIDIKRRGLPAEMPVFLPGLGAYVKWQAIGVSPQVRAAVSLAGPLAGWFAAAVCAAIFYQTHEGVWAALAYTGAALNVLNLTPVWMLDGGQAAFALSKTERFLVLAVCVGICFASGQKIFLLVAAGAAWRLFTKDAPEHSGPGITAYFIVVLTGLAVVMWLMPQRGLVQP